MDIEEIIKQVRASCYATNGKLNSRIVNYTWWKTNNLLPLRNAIINCTNFLPDSAPWPQRIWHINNSVLSNVECSHTLCSDPAKWNVQQSKYQSRCAGECNGRILAETAKRKKQHDLNERRNNRNIEKQQRKAMTADEKRAHANAIRKQNMLKKHGVEHQMYIDSVKERIKQTCHEKYGVSSYSKTSEYKARVRNTSLNRYGVTNPAKHDSVKLKMLSTCNEKYGTDSYTQCDAAKQRMQQYYHDMYGSHPTQQHISETALNILQSHDLLLECVKTHTAVGAAIELEVDYTTVIKYVHLHNLQDYIANQRSAVEIKIEQVLDKYDIQYVVNDRSILKPKELDFYIPEYNLAIEVNGVYWHSDKYKDKDYHYNKWKLCRDNGIMLLSVYDDDINDALSIIDNKIMYLTHRCTTVIGARKLLIADVDKYNEYKLLDMYHIQGKLYNRDGALGAYHNDKLVAVINWKYRNKYLEITRYCCDTNASYPGLFSKMTKAMIAKTQYAGDVVSFSNNDHSNGNVYKQSGFTEDEILGPAYWYTKGGTPRENRQKYMKSKIAKKFNIDMSDKTEWQAMQELGYNRVWDTGKIRWKINTKDL